MAGARKNGTSRPKASNIIRIPKKPIEYIAPFLR